MSAAIDLAPLVGIVGACVALAVSRATLYRKRSAVPSCAPPRPTPARALSAKEREAVLEVANSERFVDTAPAEIVATLLDDEPPVYLCSPRTMYRVLAGAGEVRERRDQLRHPEYRKPELMATAPNQVWTWDITKLLCHGKWQYLYLYVLLDLFSRYVVGWLLAKHENAKLAKRLIRETWFKEDIQPGQLTIHGDRGAPMTSKTLAQLMADLVVTKSHSRPRVSDDNPFSEAQFKTIKYRPDFPDRFGGPVDGRSHFQSFFSWYNNEHRHSGIAYLTPSDVHHGRAQQVLDARQAAMMKAFTQHPERFRGKPPHALALPSAVWINPPKQEPPPQDRLRSTCNTDCNEVQPILTADPETQVGLQSIRPRESGQTELGVPQ
jgi:putative transposase